MPQQRYASNAHKQAAYRARKAKLTPTHFHRLFRWQADQNTRFSTHWGAPGSGVTIIVLPTHATAIAYRDGYMRALTETSWDEYDLNMAHAPDGTLWVFDVESTWRHVCPDCEDYVWSYSPETFDPHMHLDACSVCGQQVMSVDGNCIPHSIRGEVICDRCITPETAL